MKISNFSGAEKMARLKVAWLYRPQSVRTGASTYARLVLKALEGEVEGKVVQKVPEYGFDLVHLLDLKQARQKDFKTQIPVISDLHDYYWAEYKFFPSPDFFLRWAVQKRRKAHYQRLIKKSQAIIVHSRAVGKYVKHSKVYLVPIGIEFEQFYKQPESPRDELVLLVGRDAFRKGLWTLIKAFKLLKNDFPKLQAKIIGDEYFHSKLIGKILARGAGVEFCSGMEQKDLIKEYQRAMIVFLGSWQEGFGLSLVEGIASGCLAICSGAGGMAEIVKDGFSGLVFTPGNHKELVDKIALALRNEDLRIKLVENAQEQVRENFSLERMKRALIKAYKEVAELGR